VQPGLHALRDVTPALLETEGERLDDLELKRVRHVVTENQRVLKSVAALRVGDVARFGQLMVASHASLRDDYEVSGPELDTLVALAMETPGVQAARWRWSRCPGPRRRQQRLPRHTGAPRGAWEPPTSARPALV
jgi:galactokinase